MKKTLALMGMVSATLVMAGLTVGLPNLILIFLFLQAGVETNLALTAGVLVLLGCLGLGGVGTELLILGGNALFCLLLA